MSGPAGELTLLSVLPGEAKRRGVVYLGAAGNPSYYAGEGRMTATAISNDGTRVEWNASDEGDPHLYMREVPQQETLQVDELQSGVATTESRTPALFQTASTDGSKVFFTDAPG